MYKSILAILLVGLLAAPIMAQPAGPIPVNEQGQYGWGIDCNFWGYAAGDASMCALHTSDRPDYDCDNDGWIVYDELTCNGSPLQYPFLFAGSVELWIELYAQMTCRNTSWRIHMLSDGQGNEDIYFWVYGDVYSNSEIVVNISGGIDNPFMDLQFMENIFGDAENNMDIAMNYAYVAGSYENSSPPDIDLDNVATFLANSQDLMNIREGMLVGPCDWWWLLFGWGCVTYHTPDGYYLLTLTICPTPFI